MRHGGTTEESTARHRDSIGIGNDTKVPAASDKGDVVLIKVSVQKMRHRHCVRVLQFINRCFCSNGYMPHDSDNRHFGALYS